MLRALGREDLTGDPRFAIVAARFRHSDELIAECRSGVGPPEIEDLREKGVNG
jgi:hypothetical protein